MNGGLTAQETRTAAAQMTVINMISGLSGRLFIDWYRAQVGPDVDWFSDTDSYNCLDGFEIKSVIFGEDEG